MRVAELDLGGGDGGGRGRLSHSAANEAHRPYCLRRTLRARSRYAGRMQIPPTSPPVGPAAESADRVVLSDVARAACVRCSYSLEGLPDSGACPECGTPIALSLRGWMLRFAAREYLAGLALGLRLIVTCLALLVALVVASVFAGLLRAGGAIQLVLGMVGLAITAGLLAGYWLYSQPDPGYVGTRQPDEARRVLRVAICVQAVCQLVLVPMNFFGQDGKIPVSLGSPTMLLVLLANFVATVAWVAQFFGVMHYTRWIANRIPDSVVAKRCSRYMWLLPVLAVVGAIAAFIGPVVAFVMYWNLLDKVRKEIVAARKHAELAAPLPG